MKTKKVIRYYAECGKAFWNRLSCLNHEENCKCWKNPKYKTCLTCKHHEIVNDTNGMEHEPHLLHKWIENKCNNEKFIHDIHFNEAHEKAPDLCINCTLWESNKFSPLT